MILRILYTALVIVVIPSSYAVGGDSCKLTFKNVKIRQTTIDKNAIKKPASFQFIIPGNKSIGNSYLIDLGITYEGCQVGAWAISPTFEYHRNTLIEKPQNNLQAGITAFAILGDVTEPGFVLVPQLSIKYKYDKFRTDDAMISKLELTGLYPRLAIGNLRGPIPVRYLWQPTVGIQYESAANVQKTGMKGEVLRLIGNLEFALYPYATKMRRNIELVLRITYWNNVVRSGASKDVTSSDQHLKYVGLLIYLDDGQHAGFGIDYSNGENPEQGLANQETTTISFKLKF